MRNKSDNTINFPLFHGTSSYFVDSICKHGLGGFRDPEIFDAASSLYSLVFEHLDSLKKPPHEFQTSRIIYEKLLRDNVTAGGLNFRYGGVYLASSKQKAEEYALHNPIGSEYLSKTFKLLNLLKQENENLADRLLCNYPELKRTFLAEHKPCLITLRYLEIDNLKTENGQLPHENIKRVEKFLNDYRGNPEMLHAFTQQLNFELIIPLPVDAERIEITFI